MQLLSKREATADPNAIALMVSRTAAVAVVVLAVSVLYGWSVDSELLKSGLQGYTTMNPISATCFLLVGLSLYCATLDGAVARQISLITAALVIFLASWRLAAFAHYADVRPDRLLFPGSLSDGDVMHQSTAVGFILAASALIARGSRLTLGREITQYLGFMLGMIALFAATGHIYGAGFNIDSNPFALPSLHTSLGFFVLAIGLAASVPTASQMRLVVSREEAGKVLQIVLPITLVIPALFGWLVLAGVKSGEFDQLTATDLMATWSTVQLLLLTFVTVQILHARNVARARSLAEARSSEERLAGILNIAGDAIISVDGSEQIILFNAAAERLFGYSRDEAVGKPLDSILPGASPKIFPAADATTSITHELTARRKDGEDFPAEVSIARFRVQGDAISTLVLRDMTEHRRAAKALMEAKERAEDAARVETEFLANMSHEIRTPLNSISGFTQLLLERDDIPPEPSDQIRKIKNATSSLMSIVNDILDYSKLENSTVSLSPGPLSLFQIANDCVSIVSSLGDLRAVPVSINASPELKSGFYIGDANRIRQILLNLLGNALKFTAQGSITVQLSEEKSPEGGAVIRVAVADTGIGISQSSIPKLFQRFSQVDGSLSRTYSGSGLGLAICKRLVTLMGGDIGVDSRAGEGSTFWFTLPLQRTSRPEAPALPSGQLRPSTRPRSILLVEDVELNQEIALAMLTSAGHTVEVASNGALAIACVQRKNYDIILMDVQMPVMDGITAARKIRQMPGRAAGIPIVAMTANVLPSEVPKFFAAGMTGYLRKPVDLAELLSVVEKQTAEWQSNASLNQLKGHADKQARGGAQPHRSAAS